MKLDPALVRTLQWRGLPVLVLGLALCMTLGYWLHECDQDRAHLRSAFEAGQREASLRIAQRLDAHEHMLQGLQGFLLATPQATPHALRRYVDALPLGADFAGVQGLLRVELVPAAQREAFVAQAHRAGPGVLHPPGERELYAPVAQVEPALAGNRLLQGLDLLAQAPTRQALERARDSGRMAVSGRLELAELGLAPGPGFLMVLPLYADDGIPASLPERRERLRGWVAAPVRMQALMSTLYGELPRGLGLALYDGQTEDESALLYRGGLGEERVLMRSQEFLVPGGQTWTLALLVGPGFAASHGATGADVVLVTGAGFAALLTLLAWLLGTARERAQALAERMTRALRESEQRWAFALEGAGDGVWDWQVRSGMVGSSARWRALMHLPADAPDLTISELLARIHPDDLPRLHGELQRCLDGSVDSLASEHRIMDGTGSWRWVLARGTVIERDAQGLPVRMIGTLSDITARRESEERVRFMALHDPLTELANRAHFDERLHFALANARRYKESIGLILLDLDRFKPVNDEYGHAVGDQLLQAVARRIRNSVRETDTVGRIGGDEFVVLLTGPVTRESAQVVADKIFNQVAAPLELGGLHLEITCSLGLALYPEDGQDELALTKAADDAMYRNKRAGRSLMDDARSGPASARPGDLTAS